MLFVVCRIWVVRLVCGDGVYFLIMNIYFYILFEFFGLFVWFFWIERGFWDEEIECGFFEVLLIEGEILLY